MDEEYDSDYELTEKQLDEKYERGYELTEKDEIGLTDEEYAEVLRKSFEGMTIDDFKPDIRSDPDPETLNGEYLWEGSPAVAAVQLWRHILKPRARDEMNKDSEKIEQQRQCPEDDKENAEINSLETIAESDLVETATTSAVDDKENAAINSLEGGDYPTPLHIKHAIGPLIIVTKVMGQSAGLKS